MSKTYLKFVKLFPLAIRLSLCNSQMPPIYVIMSKRYSLFSEEIPKF